VHDPMGGFGADVDVYKAVREKPAMRSVWISSIWDTNSHGFAHSLRGFSRGFGDPSVSDMLGVQKGLWRRLQGQYAIASRFELWIARKIRAG